VPGTPLGEGERASLLETQSWTWEQKRGTSRSGKRELDPIRKYLKANNSKNGEEENRVLRFVKVNEDRGRRVNWGSKRPAESSQAKGKGETSGQGQNQITLRQAPDDPER